jgi:hypothetical protein
MLLNEHVGDLALTKRTGLIQMQLLSEALLWMGGPETMGNPRKVIHRLFDRKDVVFNQYICGLGRS